MTQAGDEWSITVEGMKGVLIEFPTRDEAVAAGSRIARAARSRLHVSAAPPTETAVTADGEWPGPIDEEPPLFVA